MKRITKILIYFALAVTLVLCLASCEDLLSNGAGSHQHEYGAWGEDSATCEAEGTQTRICKICNAKSTRKTQPLGHDYVVYNDKAPSCTENGYNNYKKCSRCSKEEGSIVDMLGHTFDKWTGNTATCLEGGKEFSKCSVCGHDEERPTEPLGHSVDFSNKCTNCGKKNIIVLIEDGKANFNVIFTAASKGQGKSAADSFVKKLKGLGVEVNNAVSDSVTPIKEYEIIIGAGANGRGDACKIDETYLGNEGYIIKIVGKKIIIAGGTPELTYSTFNKFLTNGLGITSSTKSIDYLEVDSTICEEKTTDYVIDNIKLGGYRLSDYDLVLDISGVYIGYQLTDIRNFHDAIYELSGEWMNQITPNQVTENGKYFIIRYVEDAGPDGFRAGFQGDDFVVECAYQNVFNDTFREFANTTFLYKSGDLIIPSDFTYSKNVSVVYYEDFKAKGDGTTCDWEAIYNTHIFANAGGQKVMSKLGSKATYYISAEGFIKTIPVKTDTDFCGATFRINDRGDSAYKYRKLGLFTLERDSKDVSFYDNDRTVLEDYIDANGNPAQRYVSDKIIDDERFQGISFKVGETDFSWLAEVLPGEKNLVYIENKMHKDFVRHGSNQTSGATRRDIFIVNKDGTVESDSTAVFDFDNISAIRIFRADEKPITVENGNFINICCRVVQRTVNAGKENEYKTYANAFHEYQRGFIISRTNATINNVTHAMEGEPDLGWYPPESEYDPATDTINTATYGSRYESYPYYGFVWVSYSYNFTLNNSQLTGHSTYYEDKPATASTGWQLPPPVPMGSYDFVIEVSSNIYFNGVTQVNKPSQQSSADKGDYSYLTDTRYWGIMSSNTVKNLNFDGCAISRFDAHRGFWNATLKDTYIGHSFHVIGGGLLTVDNVTKGSKASFIALRGDYGATFDGDMIITNSSHEARGTYNSWQANQQSPKAIGSLSSVYLVESGFNTSNSGYSASDPSGAYWLWDFGFTCYMPRTVTIDNFTSKAKTGTYVFNNLPDKVFTKTYVEGQPVTKDTVRYPYKITDKIIQKNMSKVIPTTTNVNTYKKLAAIPVEKINIGN